jgi:hypothetical protein
MVRATSMLVGGLVAVMASALESTCWLHVLLCN